MPADAIPSSQSAAPCGSQSLIEDFLKSVKDTNDAAPCSRNYGCWTEHSKTLVTTSKIHSFRIGIGAELIEAICPAIENAKHEIIIVTCFWAKSSSQRRLAASILNLAQISQREHQVVHVRICLSSLSLWQKLTQTSSLNGHIYPPSTWPGTFGLPRVEDLMRDGFGVELTVKSIFVRPMSVMHPKFIIIDQARLFLPSCNISWEDWFEGCIEMSGGIVSSFLDFYRSFWDGRPISLPEQSPTPMTTDPTISQPITTHHPTITTQEPSFSNIPTLFLPSPHHPNPHFRPLPYLCAAPSPPPTPLNTFLLHLFSHAIHHIRIQTPNLTSPPVLSALHHALARGVHVSIVTSTRMMLLEQLVTAGTVTELCANALIRRHRALVRHWRRRRRRGEVDEEAGATRPGELSVRYFIPRGHTSEGEDVGTAAAAAAAVKSHLKMTRVDGEVVVLGSGNMDRASWYTSQEVGVALFGREVVGMVGAKVEEALVGRVERG